MDNQTFCHQNSNPQIKCISQLKTNINIDCIKVCPMDKQLWAFSFYQQHPEFVGGVQVLTTSQLQSKDNQNHFSILANKNGYLEIGPIMHIEWLNVNLINKVQDSQNNKIKKYYILAAHRCDQAILLSYQPKLTQLQVEQLIFLQKGIFCLYCDWKLIKNSQHKQNQLQCIAIVSSNESSVFCFSITIDQSLIKVGQKIQYKKHENAVWACKLNPIAKYIVVGDEVNCLYLYSIASNILIGKNNKAHDQGICQIIWKDNEKILSGSFDGTIAEISTSNFEETLRIFKIGGTIWRIIPMQLNKKNQKEVYLICNSSEKEFQIYDTNLSKVIWKTGNEHQSLAYAADYNDKIIVTASFYDQAVIIWRYIFK